MYMHPRISVTVISRLILNLHAYGDNRPETQAPSRYLTWFARAADNLTTQMDRGTMSNLDDYNI